MFAHGRRSSCCRAREMALDLGVAHVGKRGRPPARLVILIDDHGAHALVEVMVMDEARHYAEFRAHARVEIPLLAAAHLLQRDLETERRFGPHGGGGLGRPFGIGGTRGGFLVERGEDVLDAGTGKQPVDRRRGAPLNRPLARRLREGAEHGIDRDRAGKRPRSVRESARRECGGWQGRRRPHRRRSSARRSARKKCRARPAGAAETRWRRRRGRSRCRPPAWRRRSGRRPRDASRAARRRRRRP